MATDSGELGYRAAPANDPVGGGCNFPLFPGQNVENNGEQPVEELLRRIDELLLAGDELDHDAVGEDEPIELGEGALLFVEIAGELLDDPGALVKPGHREAIDNPIPARFENSGHDSGQSLEADLPCAQNEPATDDGWLDRGAYRNGEVANGSRLLTLPHEDKRAGRASRRSRRPRWPFATAALDTTNGDVQMAEQLEEDGDGAIVLVVEERFLQFPRVLLAAEEERGSA